MMMSTSWITSIADILPKLPQIVWDWWLTLPDVVPAFTVGLIVFAIAALMGQLAAIVMVLMERKVLSWFTQRKGPNRVGPLGLLQTIADGVKLLFKEDIMNYFLERKEDE
jgi:NADH-quinone oxidoreductase subunit H